MIKSFKSMYLLRFTATPANTLNIGDLQPKFNEIRVTIDEIDDEMHKDVYQWLNIVMFTIPKTYVLDNVNYYTNR